MPNERPIGLELQYEIEQFLFHEARLLDRNDLRTWVSTMLDEDMRYEVVMREALMREHQRGGQSFIVVPRIADMTEVEDWLRKTVPEVRFVTAHGQMSPTEVEERMSAFYEKKYEVLLSTTIVESGIDIPSANTIIIHRADRFGLAQLYQLRGRVGRAKLRAYAYLTTPPDQALSEVAEKRLKVLGDPAISVKSASNCTSRCSKTRFWRCARAIPGWNGNAMA